VQFNFFAFLSKIYHCGGGRGPKKCYLLFEWPLNIHSDIVVPLLLISGTEINITLFCHHVVRKFTHFNEKPAKMNNMSVERYYVVEYLLHNVISPFFVCYKMALFRAKLICCSVYPFLLPNSDAWGENDTRVTQYLGH